MLNNPAATPRETESTVNRHSTPTRRGDLSHSLFWTYGKREPNSRGRGDGGERHPRPFRCTIVTLSDRVAAGVYNDRSGPRASELLDEEYLPEILATLNHLVYMLHGLDVH